MDSQTQDARRHEARLSLALEAAGLGNWEFIISTGVLTASDRCKANHGLPPHATLELERDIIRAIDPSHQPLFRQALEATIRDGVDLELEVPNSWPDGSHHWLMIRGRRVDEDCLLGVTLDVTERRRMENALREHDQRKDDFLALLAHELRNPLAPIVAAAEFLEETGPPDDGLQRARETIMRQSMQLGRIIDDLMDVGRIKAGKLHLDKQQVDLNTALQQAIEACSPLVDRHRHTLTATLAPQALLVDADPTRLVQALSNLIINAAKYMNEGGCIDVTCRRESAEAIICVRDEGFGIDAQMIDTIFDRFVQVGASANRAEGGLGLGLPFVKAIVELHQGRVDARSAGLGHGSEFTVRLPAAGAVRES